jgi:hypothetical protein
VLPPDLRDTASARHVSRLLAMKAAARLRAAACLATVFALGVEPAAGGEGRKRAARGGGGLYGETRLRQTDDDRVVHAALDGLWAALLAGPDAPERVWRVSVALAGLIAAARATPDLFDHLDPRAARGGAAARNRPRRRSRARACRGRWTRCTGASGAPASSSALRRWTGSPTPAPRSPFPACRAKTAAAAPDARDGGGCGTKSTQTSYSPAGTSLGGSSRMSGKAFLLRGLGAAALLLGAGCAQPPETVAAAPVGAAQYYGWDCWQLRRELGRLDRELADLYAEQRQSRNDDALGYVFALAPLASMSGGDLRHRIALRKGEHAAVQQIVARSCHAARL